MYRNIYIYIYVLHIERCKNTICDRHTHIYIYHDIWTDTFIYVYIYIYTRIFGPRFARPRFFEDPQVPCNTTALRLDWKTGPFRNFLAVASRLSRRDSTLHRVVGNTIDDVGAYFLSVPAKVLERWTQVVARPCFDIGVRYITLARVVWSSCSNDSSYFLRSLWTLISATAWSTIASRSY